MDDNRWGTGIFQKIMDFCSNPEVDIPEGEDDLVEVNGINKLVINIKLWYSQFKFKDQYTDWVPLKLVK